MLFDARDYLVTRSQWKRSRHHIDTVGSIAVEGDVVWRDTEQFSQDLPRVFVGSHRIRLGGMATALVGRDVSQVGFEHRFSHHTDRAGVQVGPLFKDWEIGP